MIVGANVLSRLKDSVLKDKMIGKAVHRIISFSIRERWNLHRMRYYWNGCANENARKHIAIDDWDSEDRFHQSGLRDSKKILDGRAATLAVGARVLEIGCGIGRLLKPLALERSDLAIYGVDVSTEMILQGKERLSDFPNIYLSRVNGKDLALFENEFFDLVFSYITFQHIPRPYLPGIFAEVYRVLKKKGVFTFQMQSLGDNTKEEPPKSDFRTIRYYTPEMLRIMCVHYNFHGLEIKEPVQKDGYLYVTVVK